MSDPTVKWNARTFKSGVTYISRCLSFDTGEEEEVMFLVLKPSDKYWNHLSNHPIQYWALNLYNGEHFEFHRDSVIAENATEFSS